MADRVQQYLKKLLDIWNKYTSKQKTLIISAAGIVIIAFALLIILMRRTDYKLLTTADNTTDTNAIVSLLKSNNYKYKVGSDDLTISVDAKHQTDAVLLLAGNNMPSTGLTQDELLNNSLNTTNSDRTLKLNLFFSNQLRQSIMKMDGIDDAEVYYLPADSNSSILEEQKDTSVSILLTTNNKFEAKTAKTIAEVVATAVGNKNTDLIKVADQYGNLLFGGGDDLYNGDPSNAEDFKELLRNTFKNNIYMGLIQSGWDDAVIMPNLDFNMDKVSELLTEYIPADGQDQGLLSHSYTYDSENAGTSGGGAPGTDSNTDTTYQIPDSSSNTGTVKITDNSYTPSQRVTNTEKEIGAIIPAQSSIGIVLRRAVTYKEEDLQAQGLLNGITFQQYANQNSALKPITVDPGLITLVSKATGIAEKDITINAYEQPVFVPKVVKVRSLTDYLQIILAVLIVGMLAFVVFKGVGPVEVTELEPELSVEQLLATTKENQTIEDIEFNEVSEVRRMIEKFVDEKPEAVAQLLRNWLNEDWN